MLNDDILMFRNEKLEEKKIAERLMSYLTSLALVGSFYQQKLYSFATRGADLSIRENTEGS